MFHNIMTGRPRVLFDPCNKDHRKWAAKFFNNRSWRDCPVRFVINDRSLDLVGVIQRQLIGYYAEQEFNEESIGN